MIESKSPRESETVITELMVPSYANFGGKIHGGILLSMMDKVAYACATKHCGSYCVTVSVGNVDFVQPVEVGELVSMRARIHYVGNSSMVIGIMVTAENVRKKFVKHTNTSYFTMVAKDDEGNPMTVPPLKLESTEEVLLFYQSMVRKKGRKEFHDHINKIRDQFDLHQELPKLDQERCIVELAEDD